MSVVESLFAFRSGRLRQAANQPVESSSIPHPLGKKSLFFSFVLKDEKNSRPNSNRFFVEH